MADYTTSKKTLGSTYLPNEGDSSFQDVEPLLTPQQLKDRFLFGIPLISAVKDPITGRNQIMTDDILNDVIMRSISWIEMSSFIIFPRQFKEKKPWDVSLYSSLAFTKLDYRPIASIEKLSIRPANDLDVFVFPLEWVETAYLATGQINIVPINVAAFNVGQISNNSSTSGGVFWMGQLTGFHWVPAYWYIEYTAGFPNGAVPRIINEAIGLRSAITVLQQLQATRAFVNSQSLGLDGMQQSVSGPGGQAYTPAIQLLQGQFKEAIKRIKTIYGLNLFASDIG